MKRMILGITLCLTAVLVLIFVAGAVFLCSTAGARWLGRELSRAVDREVRIGRVSLHGSAFPPFAMHDIFCFPDNQTQVTARTISISFNPSALFKGMQVPIRIHVEEPVLDSHLHQRPPQPEHSEPFAEVYQNVLKSIARAVRRLSGASVVFTNGGIRIYTTGGTVIGFSGLQGDITVEPTTVSCAIMCSSNLWSSAALQLSWEIPDNDSSVNASLGILSMKVTGINPHAWRGIAEMLPAQTADSLCRALDRMPEEIRPSLAAQASFPVLPLGTWLRGIHVEGSITDLALAVPEVGCQIADAGATVRLHDGQVELSNVSGSIGKSRVGEGVMRWNVLQSSSPDALAARFMLDLQDIHHLLMRFIPQGTARQELERIKMPSGMITGSFHLQRQTEGYEWHVTVEDFSGCAGYGNLHLPIAVQGGTATVSGKAVQLQGWSARFLRSAIGRISVRLGLGDISTIDVSAGEAQIFLEDAAAVLRGFEATEKIASFLSACSGSLVIHDCSLSGPLSNPRTWRAMLRARIDNAKISLTATNEPLTVKQATVRLDENTASCIDTTLEFLDAQIGGRLFIEGYQHGVRGVKFEASGSLGERALQYIFLSRNLPRQYRVQCPLQIKTVKGKWSPEGGLVVSGSAVYADSGRVLCDMRLSGDSILIKDLSVQDKDSNCSLGLTLRGDELSVSWRGIIRKETLDRLFVENRFLSGEIAGDFTATFDEGTPRRSSARGVLALQDAGFPLLNVPLTVARAKITADGNTVTAEVRGLQSGSNSIDITGTIHMDEQGFTLDGNVSGARFALDTITSAPGSGSDRGNHEELWDTPLRGTVRVRIGEFAAGPFRLSPFEVDALFANRSISVFATDVKLCGIAIPGRIVVSPDFVDVDVRADTRNLPISRVVECVSGEQSQLTGKLTLAAHLTGHAPSWRLRADLHGPVSVRLTKGRIFKSNLLMELLSFLNVRRLLSLKRFDFAQRGFPYREISVSGELKDETLLIHEAVFDSSSLVVVGQGTVALSDRSLNITALAMPFQIQDTVVKMIPFIGKVFGRAPVGVPVKITGTMGKAKVRPETPGAVLKNLAGVAGRVLKLPLSIIEPVINRANDLFEK